MEENAMIDYTEYLQALIEETQAQTETLVEVQEVQIESLVQLQALNGTLLVIVAFVVLNFCWACMRQWRKNVLNMGE